MLSNSYFLGIFLEFSFVGFLRISSARESDEEDMIAYNGKRENVMQKEEEERGEVVKMRGSSKA
jgi:hypothetical protein